MSGHSKWSTIKHKKAKMDAQRGKAFTKLIREITTAAREGGGDESSNPRLRQAVASAKVMNMPLSNIEKGIKKGTGELPGVSYEEAAYEGYGPGGVAVLIDTLTDNKNRTVGEVRYALTKNNGSMGELGSVAWMFESKGQVIITEFSGDEDNLMELALEAGAEDLIAEEGNIEIVTALEDLQSVKEALDTAEIKYDSAEMAKIPKTTVKVEGKEAASVLKLMDALEDLDDVQNVYANFDIDFETIDQE